MHIVAPRLEFFQSLVPYVPKKVHTLFSFGFDTLVGHMIVSSRANARLTSYRWNTAKSKMWRLLKNVRIRILFPSLIVPLGTVSSTDVLVVDFSDFKNGRQVLLFAKQTAHGRAMPVYFEILEYPIQKDSQNLFVIQAIERLVRILGYRPTLVFDRGFACPSIITHLASHSHTFVIRIKKRKRVTRSTTGRVCAVEDMHGNDVVIEAYDTELRLVVSDKPKNDTDSWYLITNDTCATRDNIINQYYHRFEIEEFFRDAKRLLGLEYVQFKTTQSLTVALWFAILTVWLFERMTRALTKEEQQERVVWQVSEFRYVLEKVRHAAWRALLTSESVGCGV